MASIFKRGRDKGRKGTCWFVSYDDESGKRRTKKGFTDKGLTEQLAGKLETEVMLRKRGMIDPFQDKIAGQRRLPIADHLQAFESSRSHGTRKHARLTTTRVTKVIEGCGIRSLGEIDRDRVNSFLGPLRADEDLSNRTYNHYLQAIDSFCNWCVETQRLTQNPLIGLPRLNAEEQIRHKRRALTPEEFGQLVESARSSNEEIQCYTGEERARIYLISYMTGLRRAEIGSLTPRSFDLNSVPPMLTVDAACSKHRKTDVLPLHPDFVEMLADWLEGCDLDTPLFPKLARRRTWLMVKKDLERVGIAYETPEGIADFHAAGRHTHITELLRNGATLTEVRELARHSDVKMTMRYVHIGIDDQAKAVAKLPGWQRIGSGNSVSGCPLESANVSDTSLEAAGPLSRTCDPDGCSVIDQQKKSPDDTSGDLWRRRESNPRPENRQVGPLRV